MKTFLVAFAVFVLCGCSSVKPQDRDTHSLVSGPNELLAGLLPALADFPPGWEIQQIGGSASEPAPAAAPSTTASGKPAVPSQPGCAHREGAAAAQGAGVDASHYDTGSARTSRLYIRFLTEGPGVDLIAAEADWARRCSSFGGTLGDDHAYQSKVEVLPETELSGQRVFHEKTTNTGWGMLAPLLHTSLVRAGGIVVETVTYDDTTEELSTRILGGTVGRILAAKAPARTLTSPSGSAHGSDLRAKSFLELSRFLPNYADVFNIRTPGALAQEIVQAREPSTPTDGQFKADPPQCADPPYALSSEHARAHMMTQDYAQAGPEHEEYLKSEIAVDLVKEPDGADSLARAKSWLAQCGQYELSRFERANAAPQKLRCSTTMRPGERFGDVESTVVESSCKNPDTGEADTAASVYSSPEYDLGTARTITMLRVRGVLVLSFHYAEHAQSAHDRALSAAVLKLLNA